MRSANDVSRTAGSVVRAGGRGIPKIADRVGGHRRGQVLGLRGERPCGRDEGRQNAVVHDRVDLHPLHLGGVLAHRVRVPVERRGLGVVNGVGGLAQHRQDDDDRATQDHRVDAFEQRQQRVPLRRSAWPGRARRWSGTETGRWLQ